MVKNNFVFRKSLVIGIIILIVGASVTTSISAEYDDTKLDSRIFQLESENLMLKREIENKTQEINQLTLEIENHTTEIEKINSELDELKPTEKEKIIEKEADNTFSISAIILGMLGVIIAIAAIGILFKKIRKTTRASSKRRT